MLALRGKVLLMTASISESREKPGIKFLPPQSRGVTNYQVRGSGVINPKAEMNKTET